MYFCKTEKHNIETLNKSAEKYFRLLFYLRLVIYDEKRRRFSHFFTFFIYQMGNCKYNYNIGEQI